MIQTAEIKIPRAGKPPLIMIVEVRTGDNQTHSWMTANTGVFNQIAIAARQGAERCIEESK